jgi:Ala-tRNA(Pro) deacylase
MMVNPQTYKLIDLFIKQGSWFEVFMHEPVRTSEEASKVRHGYSITNGAKALILKTEKGFIMAVITGDAKFDKHKLKKLLNIKDLRFATEEEVSNLTGGLLLGGVPPFGSFFGLKTYADQQVFNNSKIIFNCGDRTVSVGMKSDQYLQIEKPEVVDIV